MANKKYKLVFYGEIAEGGDIASVKKNIGLLFKADIAKVERLFTTESATIKKDIDYETALKYKAIFEKSGGKCTIEPMDYIPQGASAEIRANMMAEVAESMECPKCDFRQDKSTTCIRCGVIIEKYLKQQKTISRSCNVEQANDDEIYPEYPGIEEAAPSRKVFRQSKYVVVISIIIVAGIYWFSADYFYMLKAKLFPKERINSQFWAKTYGDSQDTTNFVTFDAVEPLTDGGFIAAGSSKPFRNATPKGVILRLDAFGNIIWQKYFKSGDHSDVFRSITEAADNSFIAVGEANSRAWAVKLDKAGNILWQKTLVAGEANGVAPLPGGGAILTGFTASYGWFTDTIWVAKLDSKGTAEWQKLYGPGIGDSINPTKDGGYILCGSESGPGDIRILKLDQNGNLQWQKEFEKQYNPSERGSSVHETFDGGYIMTGEILSLSEPEEYPLKLKPPFYSSQEKVSNTGLLKLDNVGNIEWQKNYAGEHFKDAVGTEDGGFIAVGETSHYGAGGQDIWLVKVDKEGNIQWQKSYGGAKHEKAITVRKLKDGYIASALTESFGTGSYNAFLLKIDAQGNFGGFEKTAITGEANAEAINSYMKPIEPAEGNMGELINPSSQAIEAPAVDLLFSASSLVPPEPKLKLSETTVFFGKIVNKGGYHRQITVSNGGSADLELYKIKLKGLDAALFKVSEKSRILKMGEEYKLDVNLTADSNGPKNAELVIYSNDPVYPIAKVALTGT